jgi:hypothetical protein
MVSGRRGWTPSPSRSPTEFNEKWVQTQIVSDPSILGLGDVLLRDKERAQPRAGTLDLLLEDSDAERRYEVEIQLGPTDEAHIIRTIEYCDVRPEGMDKRVLVSSQRCPCIS